MSDNTKAGGSQECKVAESTKNEEFKNFDISALRQQILDNAVFGNKDEAASGQVPLTPNQRYLITLHKTESELAYVASLVKADSLREVINDGTSSRNYEDAMMNLLKHVSEEVAERMGELGLC